MAGISFSERPECVWIVAGWAFRQVLKDLEPYAHNNNAFLDRLMAAGHTAFLDIEKLDEPLRTEITNAIEVMCKSILSGDRASGVKESFSDSQSHEMYLEGIQMLLGAVRASRVGS